MVYIHWIIATLYILIIALTIMRVILDNRQPAKTMAWVLVLALIPVGGLILYIIFGQDTRKERKIWEHTLNQLTKRSMLEFVEQQDLHPSQQHQVLINLFMNQSLALPFKDNETELYISGYEFFLSLLKEIGKAQESIHLDSYIFDDDALGSLIADALIDKARQGVEVRVIYDDVGSWKTKNEFFNRMKRSGIQIYAFIPVHFPILTSKVNYRNHRKLCIIDGKVGFIGGMNIALRYIKGTRKQPWRDTHAKITGNAVMGLQRAFFMDWYFVARELINNRKYYKIETILNNNSLIQIVTSNPTSKYPEMEQGYVRILLDAKRYVYMETPYFLPTEPVLFAMRTAAVSGVDIRLMLPYSSDAKIVEWASRSYVLEVVKAGVSVYFYKAGFNHSKLLVTDDSLATIGSTNIDFRSFEENFEANAFFYDEKVAKQVKEIFLHDQDHAITLEEANYRYRLPFLQRLWESIMRLLSPVF